MSSEETISTPEAAAILYPKYGEVDRVQKNNAGAHVVRILYRAGIVPVATGTKPYRWPRSAALQALEDHGEVAPPAAPASGGRDGEDILARLRQTWTQRRGATARAQQTLDRLEQTMPGSAHTTRARTRTVHTHCSEMTAAAAVCVRLAAGRRWAELEETAHELAVLASLARLHAARLARAADELRAGQPADGQDVVALAAAAAEAELEDTHGGGFIL